MQAATTIDRAGGGYRRLLHDSATAQVLDTCVAASEPPPSGVIEKYAVVIPYDGLFGFRVGTRTGLFDAQRTLFVTAGREYADSHPVEGVGHACLIIRPGQTLLEELFGSSMPHEHAAFRTMSAPANPRSRIETQRLRRMTPDSDPLENDECLVAALREALPERIDPPVAMPRVIDRTRQVLHALGFERLSLDRIAREVGVSPGYLTQAFTRVEGQPLYRYQLGLRLSRALLELPHSEDITGLALDLGFSSHSHFTTAFRASFGISPSDFRAGARTAPTRLSA